MSQIDIEVATRAVHDGTPDAVGINLRGKQHAPYIHRRLTLFTLDYSTSTASATASGGEHYPLLSNFV
jgi:hypothetical protein